EQRIFIKLPNCAAVRAFYVVGKNFKLWFCIDCCFVVNQNIVVLLKGIGFLRIFFHNNFSVENSRGRFREKPFIILVAFAIWRNVMYQSVVVYVLISFKNRDSF